MRYVNKIIIFLSLNILTTITLGQTKLDDQYVSLTKNSGILKIKHNHQFRFNDYYNLKKYFGTWTLNNDMLILKYKSVKKARSKVFSGLFNKKTNEIHTDTLIIKGSLMSDKSSGKAYLTKAEYFSKRKDYTTRP